MEKKIEARKSPAAHSGMAKEILTIKKGGAWGEASINASQTRKRRRIAICLGARGKRSCCYRLSSDNHDGRADLQKKKTRSTAKKRVRISYNKKRKRGKNSSKGSFVQKGGRRCIRADEDPLSRNTKTVCKKKGHQNQKKKDDEGFSRGKRTYAILEKGGGGGTISKRNLFKSRKTCMRLA